MAVTNIARDQPDGVALALFSRRRLQSLQMVLRSGTKLGVYEIVALIGKGGMSDANVGSSRVSVREGECASADVVLQRAREFVRCDGVSTVKDRHQ